MKENKTISESNLLKWLSAQRAAAYLDLNIKTFRNYVTRGLIPFHQNPVTGTKRFRSDELDLWISGTGGEA